MDRRDIKVALFILKNPYKYQHLKIAFNLPNGKANIAISSTLNCDPSKPVIGII